MLETAEPNQAEGRGKAPGVGLPGRFIPYAIVSLSIAIPCVWQPHIQAGDLSSHLYNAWLVNEVSAGHLAGLYVVPQFTNVLFDRLLSLLMKSGSVVTTERTAVLLAVQVFFWGCFRLASVAVGRPAWTAAPYLALAAYGAVFRMGFFNFYLAAGICAWAIALVWRDHPRFRLLAIPLLALAYTAHSIACIWASAVIGYVWMARRLQPSRRPWLAGIGLLSIAGAGIGLFLAPNVVSRWAPGLRIGSMLGTDQVLTFGMKYVFVAATWLCLWILLLVRRFEMLPSMLEDVPFQLLVLNSAAYLCMPDAIWFPLYHVRLTYIAIRLSLLSAILFGVVIARVRMNAIDKAIGGALVVVFFSFAYVDERAINSIETKMVRAIATLPPGARVIATVRDAHLYLPALEHLVDRACIGRCFHFADYEPPTAQFRLRAKPGNPYVMTDIGDVLALENSEYVWRRRDIDLYRLSPCQGSSDICVTVVQPGERLVKQQLDSVPKWWRQER
jgi:hypothetical protein